MFLGLGCWVGEALKRQRGLANHTAHPGQTHMGPSLSTVNAKAGGLNFTTESQVLKSQFSFSSVLAQFRIGATKGQAQRGRHNSGLGPHRKGMVAIPAVSGPRFPPGSRIKRNVWKHDVYCGLLVVKAVVTTVVPYGNPQSLCVLL